MIAEEKRESNLKDRLFWERMRKGDQEALAALFRRHYAMLYDYGMKLARQEEQVKDSIQEMFAYLWEKRQKLSPANSVRAYLLASLRRDLLKALAQQNKRQASQEEFDRQQEQEIFSSEDLLILQESGIAERLALKQALQTIPPRLREALYLKTFSGLPYRDIAAIMKISPQVARNYVAEAFQRLRRILRPAARQKIFKKSEKDA
ncbi:MAG: sigma-70 family RNA polymerase sigma factor [candidate division KSB1 bacterium]|nr:sigma-70 family RNA polymerase sigma factor [candidate division KSB1 bacterium]MDZ7364797.1 sigma-70 family RNA polymerase sigma factor [candidate division KSB1 bacterium]MDZ7402900.1 sigma-70 family RNA polymerase sigma factor [candidate division KSB1 bacterium]